VAVALVVVVVVVVVQRGDRHDVEPRHVDVARASPADAATALAALVAGVDGRDAVALSRLAVDVSPASGELMSGIAANAETLDLREVGARYVDQVGTVAADGSWSAVAEVAWQVDGDTSPSQADVVVSFAPDGDGLGIVGFGGEDAVGRGRVPLWLRGELAVARSSGVLVMVDGTRSGADEVAARVTRGIDVVRRVLPAWRTPVVVEVPGSAADLDETLGAQPGTYAAIAAVTATAGSASDDAPVHVFVNPEVTAGLRRAGAQVVMSHELVHVATDAARGGTEPWLVEGFADYVALRDTGLPDRTTLGRAIAAVRRDGVPDALPSAGDFDTRAADLQARYEEAWLACRIIAERLGERGLVSVYDAASSGAPVRSALARAGLPLRELVPLWRTRLQQLAR
jgi:predicted RecA/RadA family phage recombinase